MTGIDAAEDPEALLTFLDDAAELPEIRNAKRRATEALSLRPGDRVLEVGCGTGVDAPGLVEAVMPGGRVVGVDASALAIEHAVVRMAAVPEAQMLVADAHELPFPSESFDACRIDRTIQHLAAPEKALAELRRVLTAGGRLAVNESSSHLDGDPAVVGTDVHRAIAAHQWREHERLARITMFLPLLISRAGFVDIRVDRFAAESADFDTADRLMRLSKSGESASEAGAISSDTVQRWLADVRAGLESGNVKMHFENLLFTARAPD